MNIADDLTLQKMIELGDFSNDPIAVARAKAFQVIDTWDWQGKAENARIRVSQMNNSRAVYTYMAQAMSKGLSYKAKATW